MTRTFSIRETLLCAARHFKEHFLFFVVFSLVWGAVGLITMVALNFIQIPQVLSKVVGVLLLLIDSLVLAWLLIVLTHVAMLIHKNAAISYRELYIKPRVFAVGALTLLVIGFLLTGITLLMKLPIIFEMAAHPDAAAGFHLGKILQLVSIIVAGLVISRVLLSLCVVVDTRGEQMDAIVRSIMLTEGNVLRLLFISAFIAFVPFLLQWLYCTTVYYIVSVGFGHILIEVIKNQYLMLLLMPVFSAIGTLWIIFSILVISHVYKQLKRPDDEQAMMPSAFIN